jgi:Na+/H+ antiporter NhaA
MSWWETLLGFQWGGHTFAHSLLHWVNHGLLTIFFFVVGLEIKREFTIGHLATFRSGALPVIAAFGGIALPAVVYASIAPPELRHGWGIPIGTDTAFAVALIVLLGDRVPIELRVFLTAAVIIDDIVAILVIALFYTGEIYTGYLIAAGAVTAVLVVLNRTGVYGALPYAVCGIVLWFVIHQAGLHATLAGVVLAMLIPTRPPANLNALLAQATTVIHLEDNHTGEAIRPGPSEPALRTLDAIHARIESPADKLLRSVEPWSSYAVLPIFALANAGVVWSADVFRGNARLMCAIALGLIVGKSTGIVAAAWLAVRSGIAVKPDAYSWRQLVGAGALGGIGFTMSLFIAGLAFPNPGDYAAAKIAIFVASLIAAVLGTIVLYPRRNEESIQDGADDTNSVTPPLDSAASHLAGYQAGEIVFNPAHGWQVYALSGGEGIRKIDASAGPLSYTLGVLGMPGLTAYTGLANIGQPQSGEILVVAAASGAVGSVVGQIGRIKGCRVVGIAGGAAKCRYVQEELGFDDCLNHREPNLAVRLQAACPNGIDVYFENVGGHVSEAVLPLLNNFARVPVCGLIAHKEDPGGGVDASLSNREDASQSAGEHHIRS